MDVGEGALAGGDAVEPPAGRFLHPLGAVVVALLRGAGVPAVDLAGGVVLEAADRAVGCGDVGVAGEGGGPVTGAAEDLGQGLGAVRRQLPAAAGEVGLAGEDRLGGRQGVGRHAQVAGERHPLGRQAIEVRRDALGSPEVAEVVGAQGVHDVEEDQAGSRRQLGRGGLGGRARKTEAEVLPAPLFAAAGEEPHAHQAGGQRDGEVALAAEALPQTAPPFEGRLRAFRAFDQEAEALVAPGTGGGHEAAGEDRSRRHPADDVDQRVSGLREPAVAELDLAGRQGPAEARLVDGDLDVGRELEVDGEAAEGQVGRQRYLQISPPTPQGALQRTLEGEAADLAAGSPHPHLGIGGLGDRLGRYLGLKDQLAGPRLELYPLEAGAGLGIEPQHALAAAEVPTLDEAVATGRRRRLQPPALGEHVRGVGVVEERQLVARARGLAAAGREGEEQQDRAGSRRRHRGKNTRGRRRGRQEPDRVLGDRPPRARSDVLERQRLGEPRVAHRHQGRRAISQPRTARNRPPTPSQQVRSRRLRWKARGAGSASPASRCRRSA